VVVTVPAYEKEIREAISPYPFSDKVIILKPNDVMKATRSLEALLKLKGEIFQ
jgi:hypothetical protein